MPIKLNINRKKINKWKGIQQIERCALKTDFSKSFFIGIIMLGFVHKNGVSD